MSAENRISVSSAQAYATCPRRFFYSHELRWRPVTDADALTFGRAWHKLLEMAARTQSHDAIALIHDILTDAPGGDALKDEHLGLLLAMGCAFLGAEGVGDFLGSIASTEEAFCFDLPGVAGWKMNGFVDAVTQDGAVVEYKTTARDIGAGSDYWTRLRHNLQIIAYSRLHGWQGGRAIYVVARKPAARLRASVPVLDADGLKIVLASDGTRVLTKTGKPKQTAGEGETLQTRSETVEEFAGRVLDDLQAHREDYFAVREVEIEPEEVGEAMLAIATIVREVEMTRGIAAGLDRPDRAWRRNCSEFNCANCPFAGPCLFTLADPADGAPAGFEIDQPRH